MLSVVVATFRRYDVLPECLKALERQTVSHDEYEVLVVDNSPDEHTSMAFAERYSGSKNVRWIYQPTPGLSLARNRGVQESRYPLVAFIDDDAIAAPQWAAEILETFNVYGNRVSAVGGRIDLAFRTPRPQWLHPSLCKFLTTVDHGPDRRILEPTEEIAGANMAFRKQIFSDIGLFPVSLGRKGQSLLSNDETPLFGAIHKVGGRIAYAPSARVDHVVDSSRLVQSWFRKRIAWQAVSDALDRPGEAFNDLDEHWRWLGTYLLTAKPSERNIRGLLTDRAGADDFAHQIHAIYNAMICLLAAHYHDAEENQIQ